MGHCKQLDQLKIDIQDAKLVSGWHDGITGKSCMLSVVDSVFDSKHKDVNLAIAIWPVVIEGTNTPICFTSWTYDPREEDGYANALEVCKLQAQAIVEKFNA